MKMRRLIGCGLVLAFLVACMALPAFAAPGSDSGGSAGKFDMGALSDRYDSLNNLGNSLTDEEGVVIATRIGVLTSANRALDGSEVSFDGEVVGDIVSAGEGFKWLNLMGSSNAVISVFATDEQTQLIQNVGGYHATGTTLRITGTYHIACPEHQGELDVHVSSATLVDAGGAVTHLVSAGRLSIAFALCVIAFLLLATYLIARRHSTRKAEHDVL